MPLPSPSVSFHMNRRYGIESGKCTHKIVATERGVVFLIEQKVPLAETEAVISNQTNPTFS